MVIFLYTLFFVTLENRTTLVFWIKKGFWGYCYLILNDKENWFNQRYLKTYGMTFQIDYKWDYMMKRIV